MKATRPIVLAMLASLALAACAPVEKTEESPKVTASAKPAETTTTTSKPTQCQPVPQKVIDNIVDPAVRSVTYSTATFSDWYQVAVPEKDRSSIGNPKWPGVVIAAKLNNDQVASWGLGGIDANGEIDGLTLPLNVLAYQVTQLGELNGKPGEGNSPIAEARDKVASSKAAKQAEKCAREGKAS